MKRIPKNFRETKSKPPSSYVPMRKQEKVKLSKTPIDDHNDQVYAAFYKRLKAKGMA